MPRWTTVGLGVLLAGVLGVVIVKGRSPTELRGSEPSSASAPPPSASAAPSTSGPVSDSGTGTSEVAEGGFAGFTTLPNGAAVPELPVDAPDTVNFGVILFAYQGAQMASSSARSRDQALELAHKVLPDARSNFEEAVKKGDPGSTPDLGRVPRGVLEPAVEYVVFSLAKGAVHAEPVDTPRGFWVIKRVR